MPTLPINLSSFFRITYFVQCLEQGFPAQVWLRKQWQKRRRRKIIRWQQSTESQKIQSVTIA